MKSEGWHANQQVSQMGGPVTSGRYNTRVVFPTSLLTLSELWGSGPADSESASMLESPLAAGGVSDSREQAGFVRC